MINVDSIAVPHCDSNNYGQSVLLLLGAFSGGAFRYEDSPNDTFDSCNRFALIDGSRAHSSAPFKGHRISLVYFNHVEYLTTPLTDKYALTALGFLLGDFDIEGV